MSECEGEPKIRLERITVEYGNNRRKPRFPFLRGKRGADDSGNSPPKTVLDDIDLEIRAGEFACILGHSGCGKSTILRLIAGFMHPTKGAVFIDGREVKAPQADHIFVFQDGSLFPWLTIAENVALALRGVGSAKERREKVLYHLELVGLESSESYYPHMLSGGMRQRAEIARAMAAQPEILLMDEPFSALDCLTRLHMREEMLYLHVMLPKTTIVFVTHDIDEALQLSSRLIIMSDPPGRIKCCRSIRIPHPRSLSGEDLGKLRSQVYYHLGVHTAL